MSRLPLVKEIKVGLNFGIGVTPVGRFAMRNRTIYFEYDRTFIDHGLEISPLRLPLNPGVSSFEYDLFEGLPGVFNDSLPDGWGRLEASLLLHPIGHRQFFFGLLVDVVVITHVQHVVTALHGAGQGLDEVLE
jgi:hypothetical protein